MANLWIDLGNTRLKYWLIDEVGRVISADAKQHLSAPAELLMGLTYQFEKYAPNFIGISSVLGNNINAKVADSLAWLNIPFEFVHVDNRHKLMTSEYDPNQLGVDRWLQMLGVVDSGKRQCIVGCGTALTIDLIDHGNHLGGYIFPSIYLQREALFSGTKQISISDGEFDSILQGVTTQDAVHRGILLSIVGAINEISGRHDNYQIIMTGGDASIISQHIHKPVNIRQDLLLSGLMRYFNK
ncbi:pantothenate kinase [Psychrobacter sp. HD31]|uniref:pantothenate kinase n=1 Tax=Psychrobacter sp. HD31 TaxID=3112003 RepID=UPI003DA3B100